MSSSCAKHHPLHPRVGVCASCLSERLAHCVSTLRAFGEEEDECYGFKSSSDKNKRTLSYYLEEKKHSNCDVQVRHNKAMSSNGVCEENSLYESNYYVRNDEGGEKARHSSLVVRDEGGDLKEGSYLCEKGRPSSLVVVRNEGGDLKESPLCDKGRPSSWLASLFFKRGGKLKVNNSRECSIASWRHFESEGASHSWDAPRPSSWEQLSSWEKPSSSPLKLSYLPSSSSPLHLPPLLHSHHPSSRSSLKLPPLLSSHPPLQLSQPSITSYLNRQIRPVSSQIDTNQRCGHSLSAAQSRKKKVWFRVFLRNKWTVKFKRHFAEKERQEAPDSARASSVKESDYLCHSQNHYSIQARHSQNHCLKEKIHYQNQPFSTLDRPSRAGREVLAGSVSGRDYGAWESYYSPVPSHSFNGVQGRHRYSSSLSCVQRRESTELLRFYLTPLRGPSLRGKIR